MSTSSSAGGIGSMPGRKYTRSMLDLGLNWRCLRIVEERLQANILRASW